MVDQFLPNSVYVVELCRELRKYAKITIFCKKRTQERIWMGSSGKISCTQAEKEKWLLYGNMEKACSVCKRDQKGSYDVVHVQSFKDANTRSPCTVK